MAHDFFACIFQQQHTMEHDFLWLGTHSNSIQCIMFVCFLHLQLQTTTAHDFFGWEFAIATYNGKMIFFGWELAATECKGNCIMDGNAQLQHAMGHVTLVGHLQLQHTMAHYFFVRDSIVATCKWNMIFFGLGYYSYSTQWN